MQAESNSGRFLIVCGGTGGHLAPGIAIAGLLEQEGYSCSLLTSRKEVDSRLVAKYEGLNFVPLHGAPFGWKPVEIGRFLGGLVRGLGQSFRIFREQRPDAVVAFGGFLSVAVVLLATLFRVPVILHEANRRPGKAVRLLRRLARRIYVPEGVLLKGVPGSVLRHYGYPVRAEMVRLPKAEARRKLGVPVEGRLLLVLGGSQGAAVLNDWVNEHWGWLSAQGINVYCLCGMGKGEAGVIIKELPNGDRMECHLVPFTDRMAEVLSMADLALSRAGAGTIAELARCRVPSILVPFPYAADGHQSENARFLEKQGGCLVVEQAAISGLREEVSGLIFNDFLLGRMRYNLERIDDHNQTGQIVRDLVAILQEGQRKGQMSPWQPNH